MPKNIDPLQVIELLRVLCEMRHGDVVVLADALPTCELQPWANFLFKKGVIAEALRP